MLLPTTNRLLDSGTLTAPLSQDDTQKYAIQTYAIVGSLGALVWDIIICLPQDFRLATQYRINISFIVYCISRLSALAYLLGVVVAATSPINDCSAIQKISFIYPIAVPSTLLLFVFRVCALYHNNRYAVAFFASLWIGLLVTSIVMPFGVSGYKLSYTGQCVELKSQIAYDMMDLPPFIHDTIIFFATSWAFISNSFQTCSLSSKMELFLFGKFLPAFSRAILRDGQLYYLSILLLNIALIVVYRSHNPPLTACTFAMPLYVLMNTLAGHIYRNIRFRVYTDYSITSSVIDKDLRKLGVATGSCISHSSNPTSVSSDPYKLDIVFKKSATTTSPTGFSHLVDVGSGIQSDVGRLDSEKLGDV